jgi:hypothetical protein
VENGLTHDGGSSPHPSETLMLQITIPCFIYSSFHCNINHQASFEEMQLFSELLSTAKAIEIQMDFLLLFLVEAGTYWVF